MQFLWACPSCSSPLRVDTANAGRKSRCPKCQAIFTLPASDPSVSPVAKPVVAQLLTPAAPARPAGRRMLPPPRKPASESVVNPTPDQIPTSDFGTNPAGAESEFLPQEQPAGGMDFLSDWSDPLAGAAETAHATPAGSGSAISKSARSSIGRRPAPKNQKWIWVTTGGVAAGVAVLVLVIVLLSGNSAPPADAPPQGIPAHLVFDWPENERLAAQMEIDGKTQTVPINGAIDLELPPGNHRIAIRRFGNTQIDQAVVLKQGERQQFKPEWKAADAVAAAAISAKANSSSSDILVTDALPDLKHWSTDLDAARRQAAREKKDILVVFFGADSRQWCLKLAANLLVKKEFRKFVDAKFELVLLEEPPASSMVDGKGIGQAAAIAKTAADYTVTSFPTIVLTDAEGTAYAREEYKDVDVVDHLQTLSSGLALRKERDKLFAATETGPDAVKVGAAQLALEWITKNDLTALYTAKVHGWLELSEKVDPNNENGQLESFFFAEARQRLTDAGKDNPQKILEASQPLIDWQKAGRKFKDGDTAARLYLEVAGLLFNTGDPDDGVKLVEGAFNCNPTNPRLRNYLTFLHERISSPVSFGSGFVFAPGGYILTNNHVIAGDGKIFVRVPGTKKEIPAQLVGASPQLDVAVIKMVGDIPTIKPLPLATTTLPRGTEVVAFGYPLGQEDVKLTQGPVSAPPSEKERFYVLDLRVNPGNSGGPLVDMRGEVVGIVSAKTVARDEKEDSYGLAIPGQTVAGFIKQLTPSVPDYHPLSADETAKLTELDKLTKVDAIVSPAVVQIVKRRN